MPGVEPVAPMPDLSVQDPAQLLTPMLEDQLNVRIELPFTYSQMAYLSAELP